MSAYLSNDGRTIIGADAKIAELTRKLDQESQDRKQAEADVCRALGERNDARAELAEARRRGDRMDRLLSLVERWSQPDVDGANWYDARREALAEWRAESPEND